MENVWQAIWVRFTLDRKKFIAMCALAAMGVLLWGRLIILERVSRTSYAEPEGTAATEEANVPGPKKGALAELPVVEMRLTESVNRDPFAARPPLFAQPAPAESTTSLAPKSEVDPSEDLLRREQARQQRIALEAQELRVDSVILGGAPIAIVDGRLVRIGGVVHGFVLEEVRERSVVVSKDGVRVRIEMDTPVTGG